MNLTSYVQDRQLTIALRGEIDHHAAREAMLEIGRVINDLMPINLELDFSKVGFMDSSGIAVVLRAFQACQAAGGHFCVRGAQKQARRVLDAAGLYRMISFI